MTGNDVVVVGSHDVPESVLASLMDEVQEGKKKRPSREEMLRDAITHLLEQMGRLTVQDDALQFKGSAFVLPAQYEGNIDSAIDFLINWKQQQQQTFVFKRTMPYRPHDGAHAFMQVMKQVTGTEGFGVTKWTIFGPMHPEFLSINVDYNTTLQVPWGEVKFPSYEATFQVGATRHKEQGLVFNLSVEAPRKWRPHIEAIFGLVEDYLEKHSIYRGKAIDGGENPTFINLSSVDPEKVVYSQEVVDQLNANVWAPIEHAEKMRALGIPLKRAVLFAGPYGTGKSLGALLTFQRAVREGWTSIMCRTGHDDPAVVLKTAELYAPAVVVIEDVDVQTAAGNDMDISKMLEMLDGIVNKGVEIVALFTTNHLDKIHKGALRPGRIDAVIKIGDLDEEGFKKLVTLTVGADNLATEVDWHAVAESMAGFLPAFVVEASRRSLRYSMARNNGDYGIMTTSDLVNAADTLRPQLSLMDEAHEGSRGITLNDQFRDIVENVIGRTTNDNIGSLQVEEPTVLNGGKGR